MSNCKHDNVNKIVGHCLDCGAHPMREELDTLRAKLQIATEALKQCGSIYSEAQYEGCDPNGAWDCVGEHINIVLEKLK